MHGKSPNAAWGGSTRAVKCPKCGYTRYPGLTQCRRCGNSFVRGAQKSLSVSELLLLAQAGPPPKDGETAPGSAPAQLELASTMPIFKRSHDDKPPVMPDDVEFTSFPDSLEDSSLDGEDSTSWRQELSDRVQDFRRKRARLRNEPDNLGFDFEKTGGPGAEALEFPDVRARGEAFVPPAPAQEPKADQVPAGRDSQDTGMILDAAAMHAEEPVLQPLSHADNRLEILVGPPEADVQEPAPEASVESFLLAPIGRRFVAGLADGLVLLAGAGLFALIFWKAGGRLTPVPLNLAVAGLIAVIFIMAYFGLFTALTFSTPGLTRMGIEVRNLEGRPPTLQEAFLRAFGYVVSASALMLGFLWALVDSESLSWHDRISGTFLTPVSRRAPVPEAERGGPQSAE